MARITVEDCLEQEPNRFSLVQLASKRTKQILTGAKTLVDVRKGNKAVVNSLREIASGLVRFKTEEDLAIERAEEEKRRQEEMERMAAAEVVTSDTSAADSLFQSAPVASESSDSDSDPDSGDSASDDESEEAEEDATPDVSEDSTDGGDEESPKEDLV